jgi:hypothetical protein
VNGTQLRIIPVARWRENGRFPSFGGVKRFGLNFKVNFNVILKRELVNVLNLWQRRSFGVFQTKRNRYRSQ